MIRRPTAGQELVSPGDVTLGLPKAVVDLELPTPTASNASQNLISLPIKTFDLSPSVADPTLT